MKIGLTIFALIMGLSGAIYAQETDLMNIQNKFLAESQEIKALLPETKDIILVSSMVDSCVLTASQLDAYFSQLGIFNTIKKENVTPAAIDFLERWLRGIQNTNELNIESLNAMTQDIQARTRLHVERLTSNFAELNAAIFRELSKLTALRQTLGIQP